MNSSSAMIPTMIDPMWLLLEVVAKADVKSAHDKKENHGPCENEVAHRFSFGCSQKRE
jgi:hypothetical protein